MEVCSAISSGVFEVEARSAVSSGVFDVEARSAISLGAFDVEVQTAVSSDVFEDQGEGWSTPSYNASNYKPPGRPEEKSSKGCL